MFLDRRCPGCSLPSSSLCVRCRAQLRAAAVGTNGSSPFNRQPSGFRPSEPPAGLDSFTAALRYDEAVARLVLAAKNGGRRDLLRIFGRELGLVIEPMMATFGLPSVVTWVPASRSRTSKRGYDQGQVLARVVARHLGIRSRRLLVRRRGEAQANLGRLERLSGPSLIAVGRVPADVLVIDDVATTGASLAAAATCLRSAGAHRVHGGVVAVVSVRSGAVGLAS